MYRGNESAADLGIQFVCVNRRYVLYSYRLNRIPGSTKNTNMTHAKFSSKIKYNLLAPEDSVPKTSAKTDFKTLRYTQWSV